MDIPSKKPCLVQTSQGFSVSYQNRLLYSKYSPSKVILNTIQNLQLLPGTIILCCSPVLSYGINELLEKAGNENLCLFCEFDQELQQFEKEQHNIDSCYSNYAYLSVKELQKLPVLINQNSYTTEEGKTLFFTGNYKRVIRVDFSAGIQLHNELYTELYNLCSNSIMTFWANRITLTKFGRKYSQNFFRNLKILPQTTPISSFIHKVSRPIIVFGAGESLEAGIKEIKPFISKVFILCVDTALQPLLKHGIEPDGVFVEEAQTIIKKAFIGTKNIKTQIFAGLSSVPNLAKINSAAKLSFFTTLYANGNFIESLKEQNLLPVINQPFGSVGLTTVYYALQFRCSENIPIYIYGLDFSYTKDKTHANGTMAHINRMLQNSRLKSLSNFGAAYNKNTGIILDKQSNKLFTTRTLQNYANLFNGLFYNQKNLFDSSESGIKLSIPHKKINETDFSICDSKNELFLTLFSEEFANLMQNFFEQERNELVELRNVLSGSKSLSKEDQKDFIIKKASIREYLYLHFPDGWRFNYELSFLKRIRTEIDFFLKYI